MKKLWIAIAEKLGWRYEIPSQQERPEVWHSVIVVAPHTCIEDFTIGATCLWKMKANPRIFMKKEFFNWFTGPILRRLGVVAVDRGNIRNGLVSKAVDALNDNDRLVVVITPEGTRKAVRKWKRGFYDIAMEAKVPIVLAYTDFGRKRMGIGPTIVPTGNYDKDMEPVQAFYASITPKYPERYNPQIH